MFSGETSFETLSYPAPPVQPRRAKGMAGDDRPRCARRGRRDRRIAQLRPWSRSSLAGWHQSLIGTCLHSALLRNSLLATN